MTLNEIVRVLRLEVRSGGGEAMANDVQGGYASDLLSDVLAHAREGDLWVTLQIHQNTVAVADMKGLAAIALVNAREPEADTLREARERDVAVLVSELPAFELIGRLYELGLSGMRA